MQGMQGISINFFNFKDNKWAWAWDNLKWAWECKVAWEWVWVLHFCVQKMM